MRLAHQGVDEHSGSDADDEPLHGFSPWLVLILFALAALFGAERRLRA